MSNTLRERTDFPFNKEILRTPRGQLSNFNMHNDDAVFMTEPSEDYSAPMSKTVIKGKENKIGKSTAKKYIHPSLYQSDMKAKLQKRENQENYATPFQLTPTSNKAPIIINQLESNNGYSESKYELDSAILHTETDHGRREGYHAERQQEQRIETIYSNGNTSIKKKA